MKVGSIAPHSVTDQIAECLAEEIIQGRLKGGDRIAEQVWAGQLEVSRGSVREALLILERWHLVKIRPRRGAMVTTLDLRWAREIAQAWFLILRAVVTWLTTHGQGQGDLFDDALARLRQLAEHRDLEAFYQVSMQLAVDVTRQTGHQVYSQMMEHLMPAARRCFRFALIHTPDEVETTIRFVEDLKELLLAGDSDRVDRIIDEFERSEMARLEHSIEAAAPANGRTKP